MTSSSRPPTVADTWEVFASRIGVGFAREHASCGASMMLRLEVVESRPGTDVERFGTVTAWLPVKSIADPASTSIAFTVASTPRAVAVSACSTLPTSTWPSVATETASWLSTDASAVLPPVWRAEAIAR